MATGMTPTPQLDVERQERDVAVEEALKELPGEGAAPPAALLLRGSPARAEAGKIMGLSKSWSSRLHARAIELLKDALKRQVGPEGKTTPDNKSRARR